MPECSPVLVTKVLKLSYILHDKYLNIQSGIRNIVKYNILCETKYF